MLIARLTFFMASLLAIGMILVNLVAFVLWQRMAFQQQVASAQSLLDHIVYRLSIPPNALEEWLATVPSGDQIIGVLQVSGAELQRFQSAESPHGQALTQLMEEAERTNREMTRLPVGFSRILSGQERVLLMARPVAIEEDFIGAVGLIQSLEPVLVPIFRAEKTIIIYMVINLLLLTTICFFRLRAQVMRPVERLARLAGRYQDGNAVAFTMDDSGNEYSRLAGKLNSLVSRVEQDKRSLKETIGQLEKANRLLAENQKEMIRAEKMAVTGRLAAGLAHEIGNPLGVVGGYLELLKKEDIIWSDKLVYIDRAEGELTRVERLIGQLKNSSRPPVLEKELCQVHPLIHSVVDLLAHGKERREISFIKKLAAENHVVYASADALKQVLINCLLNGIDAVRERSGSKGEQVVVATENVQQSGLNHLCIGISDSGVGLAAEQVESVFDPFFTTKDPGAGTGLGLTVSLALVEGIGGKMVFESRESEGSTMYIYLPIAEQMAPSQTNVTGTDGYNCN